MYVYLITRTQENGLDAYDLFVSDTRLKDGDKVIWDYEEWFVDALLDE